MTRGAGLRARVSVAAATALLATIALATTAAAGGCEITVTPSSVAVGQQFTVAGNFGDADIYLVPGDGTIPEGAVPDATTPAGGSFSVTFTAEASDLGDITVWAVLEGSECGDSAELTVVALSDTSTGDVATPPTLPSLGIVALAALWLILLGGLVTVAVPRRR